METAKSKGSKRRQVSPTTKQLVLIEAGYMCANPTCRHILTLEVHHIVWVKDGGDNEPNNLLALCPNCHSLHTAGHISHEAIRVWKGMLLALNNTNRANIDILLHLYKQSGTSFEKYIYYSGDALLYLAGLINTGLVEATLAHASSGGGLPPSSSFAVKLTDAGLMLIEAWLAGDETKLNKVLHQVHKYDEHKNTS